VGDVLQSSIGRANAQPLRRARFVLCWLLLFAQAAIPASYYLWRADPEDERFAWRMFSSLRFRSCQVQVVEQLAGEARVVPLRAVLHASWISTLRRGRQRVIARFLETRCADEAVRSAHLVRRCHEAGGRALPAQRFQYQCAHHLFSREAADGPP